MASSQPFMFAACRCRYSTESTNALVALRTMRRAIAMPDPFLCIEIANQEEEIMKMTSLIVALLTAGTLAVFGQEETVQNIKDRKSTRLNSSHTVISYAVFCLKKKSRRGYTPQTVGRSR